HNPPFSLSPDNITYAWDFGDGQTGTGQTVNHSFAAAGIYPVKLSIGDTASHTSTYIVTVRVLPEAPTNPGVRNPTVLTIATIGEPESLDPAYDYETSGGSVLQHVYETLYFYKRDSAEQLQPRLAADMPTYSADKTEVTIKLRPNVKFHNNEVMTADDVKFSLDRTILMNDPDGPAWILGVIKGATDYSGTEGAASDRAAYLAAGGVTVVDPNTVKIKLDYPDPAFLYKLAFTEAAIVSKKGVCDNDEPDFVDCLPPSGETRHPWMDTHEVGTGPFQLEAWIPGQQVVLKRFDSYWGEKPKLEKVIQQKVGDINTRLLMLFSGQADDVYLPVDHDVDVAGKSGITITEQPSWNVAFIGFNQKFCGGPDASTFQSCMDANGADAPKGANGQPDPLFFSDINMRKAWTYAFDYDTYLKDILKNHGKMLNGPLPEGIFGYDSSIAAPKRDLDMAKQFFAQTKHKDGFSVTIFYNSDNTVREKTANLLAKNLRDLGPNVKVDVRGLDWSTAFLPKQRALALPVFYLGWAPDYAFPDNYVVTFAHSQDGVYSKRVGYNNPALDAKLDALLRETDEGKLKSGWSDAVKTLNNDYVYIWLGQASNYNVVRQWVHGYYYNPMHSGGPNIGDYTTISKS
ncbi:MAG TPA: ABC transporter substrate-binding protein, partial [Candidatus Thermoplasmatota archaeon]|nr:ABC transporter substrate-binding protein [Candidatus Thermoplasmatota archaeon]